MGQETKQFKTETMRRIYTLFFLKKLSGRIAIKFYILLVLIYLQSKLIFVQAVLHNMPSPTDIPALYHFYTYAFLNTRVLVQVTVIVALTTLVFMLRDFFKKDTSLGYTR
ncbi:MAG: hypothetical protein A2648_02030 [Candidatus Lloydbacteria bacterium RIFCSPHIGHO2_01_FULL_41_20]|uniref:Uncharacterized protein n=1 Tax=Candidatus Lloydbacteria bacterium RIFCSPHIGHO2_01_FULL_41_20 TaxID=1798657 RepID=A0A1G2CSS0_9BACT|nr:MAG: hypothetical protein A2648_02030 [Candidatus Lloydbacteria bacterium RIFCSPHIGHO2_01_FULL_41_20]